MIVTIIRDEEQRRLRLNSPSGCDEQVFSCALKFAEKDVLMMVDKRQYSCCRNSLVPNFEEKSFELRALLEKGERELFSNYHNGRLLTDRPLTDSIDTLRTNARAEKSIIVNPLFRFCSDRAASVFILLSIDVCNYSTSNILMHTASERKKNFLSCFSYDI